MMCIIKKGSRVNARMTFEGRKGFEGIGKETLAHAFASCVCDPLLMHLLRA